MGGTPVQKGDVQRGLSVKHSVLSQVPYLESMSSSFIIKVISGFSDIQRWSQTEGYSPWVPASQL